MGAGGAIGVLLFALTLPACAPAAHPEAEALPSIADLRAARGRKNPGGKAVSDLLRTRIRRVDLPLDAPIRSAWDLVADDTLGPDRAAQWRRNGFRVGIIASERRRDFLAALAPVQGHHERVVVGHGTPVVLASSRGELAPIDVLLNAGETGDRYITIAGGAARLLLQIRALEQGQRYLDLLPDHHLPVRRFFRPVGARGKSAGPSTPRGNRRSTLQALALSVPLGPGATLVVGACGPPCAADQTTQPAPDPSADAATRGDPSIFEADAQGPPTLGAAILLARRVDRAIQSIFLIERPTR